MGLDGLENYYYNPVPFFQVGKPVQGRKRLAFVQWQVGGRT